MSRKRRRIAAQIKSTRQNPFFVLCRARGICRSRSQLRLDDKKKTDNVRPISPLRNRAGKGEVGFFALSLRDADRSDVLIASLPASEHVGVACYVHHNKTFGSFIYCNIMHHKIIWGMGTKGGGQRLSSLEGDIYKTNCVFLKRSGLK